MYKLILLAVAMFYSTSFALSSNKLEVIRDGKTLQKMIYNSWSEEYIQPVIDINSKTPGFTQVQAVKGLSNLTEVVTCSIKNAVYHPWSEDNQSSGTLYYSIKTQEDYLVRKKTSIENYVLDKETSLGKQEILDFTPGDLLQNVYYASEGVCIGTHQKVISKQKTQEEINLSCELLDDKNNFKLLTAQSVKDDTIEQWIYTSCAEGYKAFIRDTDLAKTSSAKKGTIVEHGTAGPAK